MKHRRVILIMALFALISVLPAAAGGRNENTVGAETRQGEGVQEKNFVELRLDYCRYNNQLLENIIQKFNITGGNIKIIPNKYESLDDQTQSRRLTEILSGDGPDLLTEIYYDRLLNNHKAVTSGVYYDMSDYFDNDKEIAEMDFFYPVIDNGVYDGKRLFITYLFKVPGVVTSLEIIKKYNVPISEELWSWEQMQDIVDWYLNSDKKDEIFLFDYYFNRLISSSFYDKYIDYDKQETMFDSMESLEYLKFIKRIQPLARPFDMDERHSIWLYITEERSLFSGFPQVAGVRWQQVIHDLSKKDGYSIDILPIPVPGEEKKFLYVPDETIGISSSCKNKEAAFAFIKYLLRTDVFGNPDYNSLTDIPVNRAAYRILTDHQQKDRIRLTPLPDRLLEKEEEILDNLAPLPIFDRQAALLIRKYAQQYFDGEISVDEAVKSMKDAVDLYLGE